MRGQASVELIVIIAFFMLIAVPLFAYLYMSSSYRDYGALMSKAENTANALVAFGELVNSQSNGTNVSKYFYVPERVKSIVFNKTYVRIKMEWANAETDVIKVGAVNFEETVVKLKGGRVYKVRFENMGDRIVVNVE